MKLNNSFSVGTGLGILFAVSTMMVFAPHSTLSVSEAKDLLSKNGYSVTETAKANDAPIVNNKDTSDPVGQKTENKEIIPAAQPAKSVADSITHEVAIAPKAAHAPKETVAPKTPTVAKSTTQMQQTIGLPPSETTKKPVEKNKPAMAYISISPGMDSVAVAKLLLKAKIISSDKEFLNELNKKKLARKIQTGVYEFQTNNKIPDVIEKITH